jgi:hypothetical protein
MSDKETSIAFMDWAIIEKGYRCYNRKVWFPIGASALGTVGITTSNLYDKFVESNVVENKCVNNINKNHE